MLFIQGQFENYSRHYGGVKKKKPNQIKTFDINKINCLLMAMAPLYPSMYSSLDLTHLSQNPDLQRSL